MNKHPGTTLKSQLIYVNATWLCQLHLNSKRFNVMSARGSRFEFIHFAGIARCNMAAPTGYVLACTVYTCNSGCGEVGEGLVHWGNVHSCQCALQTSGLAGNLFHKG